MTTIGCSFYLVIIARMLGPHWQHYISADMSFWDSVFATLGYASFPATASFIVRSSCEAANLSVKIEDLKEELGETEKVKTKVKKNNK